jgi:Fe2+ or Zn2+ uptake regulation protein
MTQKEIHEFLTAYAIRPSMQRSMVMDYLMHHRTHPTIDEIYSALSPEMPTLSKTTVYNTLSLFLEKGAVKMLTIDEKNVRYDIETMPHGHFICKECGKVHDVFGIAPASFTLPQSSDYKIDSVEISYSGVCNGCRV